MFEYISSVLLKKRGGGGGEGRVLISGLANFSMSMRRRKTRGTKRPPERANCEKQARAFRRKNATDLFSNR